MTAAGVPLEVIEEMQGKNKIEEACEVWEDNWDVVLFFMNRCGTCWKVNMNGGFTGLDRCEIESIMRIIRIPAKEREPMLDGLQTMESAALKVFREKEEKSN